jgi:hypothetical protein
MAAQKELMTQTKAALGEGFLVSPTGVVDLGKAHWDAIHALRAAEQYDKAQALYTQLRGKAAGHMAKFDMIVLQANAAEAQTALTLLNTAGSILGTLTKKDETPATPPTTTTTTVPPTTTPTGTKTATAVGGTSLGSFGTGTALAGAGSFGGVGATGLGLTGVGANPATLGGTAGVVPGAIAPGAVGAGGFAGGAGMAPGMMLGGGAMGGGHMGGKEHREGNDWLDEDEEYDVAGAANEAGGVLS